MKIMFSIIALVHVAILFGGVILVEDILGNIPVELFRIWTSGSGADGAY